MIHELLLRLNAQLPLYPPALVAGLAVLLAVLTLVLFGRSGTTILFALAVLFLGLGLGLGLLGITKPPTKALNWKDLEDTAGTIIGPASFRRYEQLTAAGLLLGLGLLVVVYNRVTYRAPGEAARQMLQRDETQSQALGSAHLCSPRTFRRWAKADPQGWTLRGRFWGANDQRLGKRFNLSGEDVARGVAVFGPQGSGKTQCLILPAIADRMRDGHSLIVTDVQGELLPYVRQLATLTGHVVMVHNPSDPAHSCAINLCQWVNTVADAQAVAATLLSGTAEGGAESFWSKAATGFVAGCLLHYPSLGAILEAKLDGPRMANELKASPNPSAAALTASFYNSMLSKEPRLANNILATASSLGLDHFISPELRPITDHAGPDIAHRMSQKPTVVVLSCYLEHAKSFGPYLGAILRALTTRLESLGRQRADGKLPIPAGLILEEFPALGRLDSLVRDINLFRKRRISVLTAAQSLAQFDSVYRGKGEADQLLAGLATKIVFGGCDQRTAEYFSELSGQQTLALASLSQARFRDRTSRSSTASLRGRALLLPDDLIRPARGHATVFAAYGEGGRAEQAIFHAQLTPFYRRRDWKLDKVQPEEPAALSTPPTPAPVAPPAASKEPARPDEEQEAPEEQEIVAQRELDAGQQIESVFTEVEMDLSP